MGYVHEVYDNEFINGLIIGHNSRAKKYKNPNQPRLRTAPESPKSPRRDTKQGAILFTAH